MSGDRRDVQIAGSVCRSGLNDRSHEDVTQHCECEASETVAFAVANIRYNNAAHANLIRKSVPHELMVVPRDERLESSSLLRLLDK